MGALIPIAIMVCLGLAYWWATVHEKKRRDKLIEMAKSLGLEISWELASQDNERFQRFAILGAKVMGQQMRASHHLVGFQYDDQRN